MNLFGRLLLTLLCARFSRRRHWRQRFRQSFRVWPHDLGWRDHLPNYRVYCFMELGRFAFWHGTRLAQSGSYRVRMVAAQDFVYLRPIAPFAVFHCDTRLMGWDQKYLYFRQDFFVKGKLVGVGLVKEACLNKGKVVDPKYIVGEVAETTTVINSWQQLHHHIKQAEH